VSSEVNYKNLGPKYASQNLATARAPGELTLQNTTQTCKEGLIASFFAEWDDTLKARDKQS